MEENLHITKQTHQQQQRTTVSRGKKNQHKRKHRKRPKKCSICKAQKLLYTYSSACTRCLSCDVPSSKGSKRLQTFLLMIFSKHHQQSPWRSSIIAIEHYVNGIEQAGAGNQSLKRTACSVVVLKRAQFLHLWTYQAAVCMAVQHSELKFGKTKDDAWCSLSSFIYWWARRRTKGRTK